MNIKALVLTSMFLIISTWSTTNALAAPAQVTHSAKFEKFTKQKDPWVILDDPEVKKAITDAMGSKDEMYWNYTQLTSEPDVTGDHLFISASVRGLFTISESFLDLNLKTKKACVGYLDDGRVHVYGVEKKSDIPKPVEDYIKNLNKWNDLAIDAADKTPRKVEQGPAKRAVSTKSITGEYERKDSRFVFSNLKVLQLPNSKLKFSIQAMNGSHSGGLDASVVPIKDGTAKYDDTLMKGNIIMKFKGDQVTITGKDEPFCGMAVTLLGNYKKIDDRTPKF
ncbi:MAG: hypothetical protein K2X77_12075 [Candidatus Obscuribacterales bacterium]|jgi:hypothetical protein|nr:hypothetical protein [Candidatus Obscuribacterales bacterium]